jgi:ParB/RepB/Spo0J family partition protein
MRIIETRDIPLDKIVKYHPVRLEDKDLEKLGVEDLKIKKYAEKKKKTIEGIAKSFDKSGLLNAVIVREYYGKYQLLAGSLRVQAIQFTGTKEISAKIVEANDFEARAIGIIENYHRQGLLDIENEKAIYYLWKDEMNSFNNNKKVMSDWIGIPYDTLLSILKSGEEKEKEMKKEDQSKAIINATARDLKITRPLEKIDSKMRRELLEAKNKKKIELEPTVKVIKKASDNNVSKAVLKSIVDLISENKLNPHYADDFVKTVVQIPKEEEQKRFVENIKKEGRVDIDKIRNFVDTYNTSDPEIQKSLIEHEVDIGTDTLNVIKVSSPDIKEKLIKKEISLEDARELNKFHSIEARNQVFNEIKTIENHKKISQRVHEEDKKRNIEMRVKQQKDMEEKGNTQFKTSFDLEKERKIELEKSRDQRHDQAFLEKYQKLELDTLNVFSIFHPRKLKMDENKKIIIEKIKNLYNHYHHLLIEIGEIKNAKIIEVISKP